MVPSEQLLENLTPPGEPILVADHITMSFYQLLAITMNHMAGIL